MNHYARPSLPADYCKRGQVKWAVTNGGVILKLQMACKCHEIDIQVVFCQAFTGDANEGLGYLVHPSAFSSPSSESFRTRLPLQDCNAWAWLHVPRLFCYDNCYVMPSGDVLMWVSAAGKRQVSTWRKRLGSLTWLKEVGELIILFESPNKYMSHLGVIIIISIIIVETMSKRNWLQSLDNGLR